MMYRAVLMLHLALLLIAAVLSPSIALAVTDLKCQTLADSYL